MSQDSGERKTLRGRIVDSKLLGIISNTPPISWILYAITGQVVRRQINKPDEGYDTLILPDNTEDRDMLENIVYDVVHALGYIGAMVATYERGDILPVRAFHINPSIATVEQIKGWEQQISSLAGKSISITDPKVAQVNMHEPAHQGNLSVKAILAAKPVLSDDLFDLFKPITPESSRPIVKAIQNTLGIQQVIAVPFWVNYSHQDGSKREIVGNLFAARTSPIGLPEQLILNAFAQQAASAIENQQRRSQIRVAQDLVYNLQTNLASKSAVLDNIVRDMVSELGYVGAMVATLEEGGILPVQAFYIDPRIASTEQIQNWEAQVSSLAGKKMSVSDPAVARVILGDEYYKDNLSYRAAEQKSPVYSDLLYDLFRPITPEASKAIIKSIQDVLGIRQVIAVPFFLRSEVNGEEHLEMIGNLFAASSSQAFSQGELEMLTTFGEQAAAGIHNAQVYDISEKRRQVSEVFAKMAFTATASVHELRNHLGVVRGQLQLLKMINMPGMDQEKILAGVPVAIDRITQAADVLDRLHRPSTIPSNTTIDLNVVIQQALEKLTQHLEGIDVNGVYAKDLPKLYVSSEMLREALRVILKNAAEALHDAEKLHQPPWSPALRLETSQEDNLLLVTIVDNGIGIPKDKLARIFDMSYTTKDYGMGFGLFWTRDYINGIGGRIEVDSIEGQGTTFRIYIPFANPTEVQKE